MPMGDIYPATIVGGSGDDNADVTVTVAAPGSGLSTYLCGIFADYDTDAATGKVTLQIDDTTAWVQTVMDTTDRWEFANPIRVGDNAALSVTLASGGATCQGMLTLQYFTATYDQKERLHVTAV